MGLTNIEMIQLVNRWRRRANDIEIGTHAGSLIRAYDKGYAEALRDCSEHLRAAIVANVVDAPETSSPRRPSPVLDSQELSRRTRDLRERLLKQRQDLDEEAA